MKQGHLSQLDIQCLVLKHPPQRFEAYEDEIQYLITHSQRNNFIKNLTLDLKGNTLVLYSRVQTHGAVLYDLINTDKEDDRKVFFVHGGVDAEEREQIREITEREINAVIIASYGTFSTGINIKNLHNIVLPLLQSLGLETSRALEEYSEKELTKPKLYYTTSLMTALINQEKTQH